MIDGFHRRLAARLQDKIEDRTAGLLQGVHANSVDELALSYARNASYMNALKDVLVIAGEIETEIYGDQARKILEG